MWHMSHAVLYIVIVIIAAGALGVFINADFVQSLVSSTAKYSALADAG